jgi:hypothetical protein
LTEFAYLIPWKSGSYQLRLQLMKKSINNRKFSLYLPCSAKKFYFREINASSVSTKVCIECHWYNCSLGNIKWKVINLHYDLFLKKIWWLSREYSFLFGYVFMLLFFVIMNSFDPKKMFWNYKPSCKLTGTEKCYMAADMKLAVDKVVINAQWHVHRYSYITSIIR